MSDAGKNSKAKVTRNALCSNVAESRQTYASSKWNGMQEKLGVVKQALKRISKEVRDLVLAPFLCDSRKRAHTLSYWLLKNLVQDKIEPQELEGVRQVTSVPLLWHCDNSEAPGIQRLFTGPVLADGGGSDG